MTVSETVPAAAAPSLFPEPQTLRLCSANVCTRGHEWIPTIALAKCGYGTPTGWNGCGSPTLVVKMEACPVCGEPVERMRFRTDYTPPIQFVIPLCIPGSAAYGESSEIVLTRNYRKVEEEYEKKFPALPVPETGPSISPSSDLSEEQE